MCELARYWFDQAHIFKKFTMAGIASVVADVAHTPGANATRLTLAKIVSRIWKVLVMTEGHGRFEPMIYLAFALPQLLGQLCSRKQLGKLGKLRREEPCTPTTIAGDNS